MLGKPLICSALISVIMLGAMLNVLPLKGAWPFDRGWRYIISIATCMGQRRFFYGICLL